MPLIKNKTHMNTIHLSNHYKKMQNDKDHDISSEWENLFLNTLFKKLPDHVIKHEIFPWLGCVTHLSKWPMCHCRRHEETYKYYMEQGGSKRTNFYVICCWLNGMKCQKKQLTMSTDGKNLKSYWITIGTTTQRGEKVVEQYTAKSGPAFFSSMTTSCHVNMAAEYADVVKRPLVSVATLEHI